MHVDTTRTAILSLYRKLIRNANKLPRSTQRSFVLERAREQFRIQRNDPESLIFYVRLAHTHIDDIEAQAKSLQSIMQDDRVTDQMIMREQVKNEENMSEEYRKKEQSSWKSYEKDE
jgi:hypothetical protein